MSLSDMMNCPFCGNRVMPPSKKAFASPSAVYNCDACGSEVKLSMSDSMTLGITVIALGNILVAYVNSLVIGLSVIIPLALIANYLFVRFNKLERF